MEVTGPTVSELLGKGGHKDAAAPAPTAPAPPAVPVPVIPHTDTTPAPEAQLQKAGAAAPAGSVAASPAQQGEHAKPAEPAAGALADSPAAAANGASAVKAESEGEEPIRDPTLEDCSIIVRRLLRHKRSGPFRRPVEELWPAEVAARYNQVIAHPIDLGTILVRLEEARYTRPGEVYYDILQVFKNCREYNTDTSSEVARGLLADVDELQEYFERQWAETGRSPATAGALAAGVLACAGMPEGVQRFVRRSTDNKTRMMFQTVCVCGAAGDHDRRSMLAAFLDEHRRHNPAWAAVFASQFSFSTLNPTGWAKDDPVRSAPKLPRPASRPAPPQRPAAQQPAFPAFHRPAAAADAVDDSGAGLTAGSPNFRTEQKAASVRQASGAAPSDRMVPGPPSKKRSSSHRPDDGRHAHHGERHRKQPRLQRHGSLTALTALADASLPIAAAADARAAARPATAPAQPHAAARHHHAAQQHRRHHGASQQQGRGEEDSAEEQFLELAGWARAMAGRAQVAELLQRQDRAALHHRLRKLTAQVQAQAQLLEVAEMAAEAAAEEKRGLAATVRRQAAALHAADQKHKQLLAQLRAPSAQQHAQAPAHQPSNHDQDRPQSEEADQEEADSEAEEELEIADDHPLPAKDAHMRQPLPDPDRPQDQHMEVSEY